MTAGLIIILSISLAVFLIFYTTTITVYGKINRDDSLLSKELNKRDVHLNIYNNDIIHFEKQGQRTIAITQHSLNWLCKYHVMSGWKKVRITRFSKAHKVIKCKLKEQ